MKTFTAIAALAAVASTTFAAPSVEKRAVVPITVKGNGMWINCLLAHITF